MLFIYPGTALDSGDRAMNKIALFESLHRLMENKENEHVN